MEGLRLNTLQHYFFAQTLILSCGRILVWATGGLSAHTPAGLVHWQVSAAIPVANKVCDVNFMMFSLFGLKVICIR